MQELSQLLSQVVEKAEVELRGISEEKSNQPLHPGGWCRKQVIGHLIDSASNNHQRFVRASIQGELVFPGYEQDACVRVQAVDQASWPILVATWSAYNRFLAHVIAHLPGDKLESVCRIGSNQPVTLRFVAEDYVTHMVHHLKQIGADGAAG